MKLKMTYFNVLPNFGDMLNEYYVQKCGYEFEKCEKPHEEEHLVMLGSILHCTTKFSTVWGAGLISPQYGISPDANILCVRGPKSLEYCKNESPIGDPALLLPKIYNKEIKKNSIIGICPNYIDFNDVFEKFKNTQYKIINLLNPVEVVLDDILSCNEIYSSSLHGLIVADAYQIPNKWICSPNVVGNNFKYIDYLQSVNRSVDFITYDEISNNNQVSCANINVINELQNNLINTCPLKGLI